MIDREKLNIPLATLSRCSIQKFVRVVSILRYRDGLISRVCDIGATRWDADAKTSPLKGK